MQKILVSNQSFTRIFYEILFNHKNAKANFLKHLLNFFSYSNFTHNYRQEKNRNKNKNKTTV